MYDIIYDYCGEDGNEEFNLTETFEGSRDEMLKYVDSMKKCGCYNISVTFVDDEGESW